MRSTFRPTVRPLALLDAPPSREELAMFAAELAIAAAQDTVADMRRRAEREPDESRREWLLEEADRYHGRVVAPLQARHRAALHAVAEEGMADGEG